MRGGFHTSGPLSLFDWLTLSVTAHSWGMLISLANCVRLAADQVLAPDCFRGVSFGIGNGIVRLRGAYDPGGLQRDHVVDVDVRSGSPSCTVIGTEP